MRPKGSGSRFESDQSGGHAALTFAAQQRRKELLARSYKKRAENMERYGVLYFKNAIFADKLRTIRIKKAENKANQVARLDALIANRPLTRPGK